MAFGTLRADTIQSDGGTAKTVNDIVVSGGALGTATATQPATSDGAGTNNDRVATTKFVKDQGYSTVALSADNTWTGAQRATLTNVDSSSGTLTIDLSASNSFLCITSENIDTINWDNLADAAVGQTGSIFFQYGGAHVVAGWAAASRWAGGTGGSNNQPTMTATSGKTDRVDYVVVRDADSSGNQRVQLVATLNYED